MPLAVRSETMLTVLPMSELDAVAARADEPGVAFLSSPPVLDDEVTVERQIVAAAVAQGIDEPTEVADIALELFDAEALLPRVPRPMSRGERQICGLLIALGQPFIELVLIDPTAGLDPRRRATLVGLLVDLGDEGARITVVTDDPLFS